MSSSLNPRGEEFDDTLRDPARKPPHCQPELTTPKNVLARILYRGLAFDAFNDYHRQGTKRLGVQRRSVKRGRRRPPYARAVDPSRLHIQ